MRDSAVQEFTPFGPAGFARVFARRLIKPGIRAFVIGLLAVSLIKNLEAAPPEPAEDYAAKLAAAWKVEKEWRGEKILDLIQPKSNASGSAAKIRLKNSPSTIRLPQSKETTGAYTAAILTYKIQTRASAPSIKASTIRGSPPWPLRGDAAEFALAAWIPPGQSTSDIEFQIPDELSGGKPAAKGEDPPGLYLKWIGEGPVTLAAFQKAGVKGMFLDVGTATDLFFLRDGFHQREGAPPGEFRWTRQNFSIEIPIMTDAPCKRIVLSGRLPETMKDRGIKITANVYSGAGKPALQTVRASTRIPKSEYGQFEITLPESLKPGLARIDFALGGSWSPKEAGMGGDPRRLGFFLDSLTLD